MRGHVLDLHGVLQYEVMRGSLTFKARRFPRGGSIVAAVLLCLGFSLTLLSLPATGSQDPSALGMANVLTVDQGANGNAPPLDGTYYPFALAEEAEEDGRNNRPAMRNTVAKQKQIMRFMPIVFGFFLARFPAGLFVYWVASNLITFCQNYLIYRRVSYPPPPEEDPTAVPEDTTRKGEGENVAPAPKTAEGSMKSGRAKRRKKKGASKRR